MIDTHSFQMSKIVVVNSYIIKWFSLAGLTIDSLSELLYGENS
jgi:hypothetical protein